MKPDDLLKMQDAMATHPCAISNVQELFRLAHLWAYGRDLAPSHAAREWTWYKTHDCVPAYVKRYIDRFKL